MVDPRVPKAPCECSSFNTYAEFPDLRNATCGPSSQILDRVRHYQMPGGRGERDMTMASPNYI